MQRNSVNGKTWKFANRIGELYLPYNMFPKAGCHPFGCFIEYKDTKNPKVMLFHLGIYVILEIFSYFSLQLRCKADDLLLRFLGLLLVDLGRDKAHVLHLPVVADVAELGSGSVVDAGRVG